jgi:hypothetical protein
MRLTPNLSKPDDGFPTLYFGDSYNAYQSQRISLGQIDNSGTNIYLRDGPRFSVSGTLVGESPSGFACGQIAVIPEGGLLDPERDFSANVCGGFRIAGLSPGSYYAVAVGVGFASDAVSFSIQNRNIERLSLPMSRTMTINGRVSSEGATSPGGLRVRLVRAMSGLDQRLEAIPRPLLVKYLPLYNDQQARRHEVRPGITGWAQVNGRNAISWEKKFELDVWYVDNVRFALDLKILWLTFLKVIRRKDISSTTSATMEAFKGEVVKEPGKK